MSLDNLPRNGEVLERLVGGGGHRFPCSMVDRVVPATTPADREAVARRLGVTDCGAVVAEPFRQWVIEHFDGPRPNWDALFVESSAPHEALKLRLLNGTHSLLAYAGLALGPETVAEAWADEDVRAAADRLATEDLVPTLPDVPGHPGGRVPGGAGAALGEPAHRAPARADRARRPAEAPGALRRAGRAVDRLEPRGVAGARARRRRVDVRRSAARAVREWRERIAADGFRAALHGQL